MAGPIRTKLTNTGIADGAVTSGSIVDGSIIRDDINVTTTGKALITKVIPGLNVNISSTGIDPGTGDVTINVTAIPATVDYSKAGSLISQRSKVNFTDSNLIQFTLADDAANGRVDISASIVDSPILNGTLTANNILPLTNNISNIGSPTARFGSIYVNEARLSTNTLYIGDTAILGTSAQTVNIHADPNQSIDIQTTGTGTTTLQSSKGVTLTSTGLNADVFVNASGSGSNVRLGATNELQVTANASVFNCPVTVQSQNVTGNLTIGGNLVINGTQTVVNSTIVTVKDNIVVYNSGELGTGVTAGKSGIQIDRGDAADYQLIFDETDDMFKVGALGTTLETLATREWSTTTLASITHNHSLDTLSNVSISNKQNNDFLKWNGTNWVNSALNQTITIAGDATGTGVGTIDITLATITDSGTGSFKKISTNTKGLVTGTANVTQTDITGLLGAGSITNAMLSDSGVTVGSYGGVSGIPGFSVDSKGLITYATNVSIPTALGYTPENLANKGVANGYASLDATAKVPASQLPSYVDDVLEYANLAAFPATGEAAKIYVTLDTNKTYRWSGSTYVEISASPGSTDAVTEGTTNLYFTNTRAQAAVASTISAETAARQAADGDLATLATTAKSNLVVAINEVKTLVNTKEASFDGTVTRYTYGNWQPGDFGFRIKYPTATITGGNASDLITGLQEMSWNFEAEMSERAQLALNLQTQINTKEASANKGVANGYASLDATAKVPASQLPSYVDDVLEYANLAAFPATGEAAKIYVTLDTNKTYRWSGSTYVEISASPGSTDAVTEGTTNLYFTNTRAQAAVTSVSGNAGTATKLLTARSISTTGDATWSVSFDGSANASAALTLANSGVTTGTYGSASSVSSITLDSKGRATAASSVSIAIDASQVITGTLAAARLGSGTASASTFLCGDGSWQTVSMPWVVRSAAYTAVAKDRIMADTSTAAFTITLPASPEIGDDIYIVDSGCSFGINNLIINPNGKLIIGGDQNLVLDVDNQGAILVYSGLTRGWVVL